MSRLLEGRVAVVTGAGRGIGRGHALEMARHGASVVVNDLGGATDGEGSATQPADDVVAEIVAAGGKAIANFDDVSSENGSKALIGSAIEAFGGLDILVNNAGILRDRTIANMTFDEWDAVVRVHLRGTFGPTHYAVGYWRERAKAGDPVDARIINTSSSSGLFGAPGQANYGAAKAGIAAFTIITALEVARYGVTANAIYPTAMSRMTEDLFSDPKVRAQLGATDNGFDPLDPENIAPLVAWLASSESKEITGRVFGVRGGRIGVAEGWSLGPTVEHEQRWEAGKLREVVEDLIARAVPPAGRDGTVPA